MSKEEFIKILRQKIDRFSVYWDQGAAEKGEVFPNELGPADWIDQFITFIEDGII